MNTNNIHQKVKGRSLEHNQPGVTSFKLDSQPQPPPLSPLDNVSPPYSPSHEFSFTVPLHPPQPSRISEEKITFDLSPADDIFFDGHLLPLRLRDHVLSPRSSATSSSDSFAIPIHHEKDQNTLNATTASANTNPGLKGCSPRKKFQSFSIFPLHQENDLNTPMTTTATSYVNSSSKGSCGREKSKPFSIFRRRIKVSDEKERNANDKVNISHALKKYMKMLVPKFSSGGKRRANTEIQRRPNYACSGRFLSAPASMGTSPVHSGHFYVKSGIVSPVKSTSDSSMEELNSAIQAAIAHCKSSFSMDNDTRPMSR